MGKKKRKAKGSARTIAALYKKKCYILLEAVEEVITVLGPSSNFLKRCGHSCEGCDYHVSSALTAAYIAFIRLGLTHQYENDPEFLKIKKHLLKWIKENDKE